MPLQTGRYTLGPADGFMRIGTGREGAAARVGHDLIFEATRWRATVTVDVEDPSRSRVRATVDAGSLQVREATGGPIGLTAAQRGEVEATVRTTVLRSDMYPRITFSSTEVRQEGRHIAVIGRLTIGERTRPITLALRVARSRVPRILATTSVVQTEFGIQPYSALMGALRVKDLVAVTIQVHLPPR